MTDWKITNKWGYLNNPAWKIPSSTTPVNYSGNESAEPQTWPLINQYNHKFSSPSGHLPCGHWHKTGALWAPGDEPVDGDAPRAGDKGAASCITVYGVEVVNMYGVDWLLAWTKGTANSTGRRVIKVSDGSVIVGPIYFNYDYDGGPQRISISHPEYDVDYQSQYRASDGIWSTNGCVFSVSES